ncbi:MAG: glycosyltransferase, partial [Clostridia bacterium]|nr:glycosyltransferase [Clostridia bacterium]
IRIINLTKNMGVSNARNIGIDNANGDYIHFIDSDDTIEKDMYENIIVEIGNKEKDLIITGTRYNENNKINIYIPQKGNINTLNEMKSFIKENCVSGRRDIFNVVWNKLYKRDFLLENDIRFDKDVTFGEDFLFNLKCMKKTNSIYIINKAYYNYMRRANEETLKMKFLRNKIHLRRLFYKKWIEFYKSYDIYEDVSKEMQIYEGFKIYMAIISVTNKNCPLKYKEKIEYINEFINFENSDCLFKYMENNEELNIELEYLKNGELERFYDIINKKLNI